MDSKYLIVGILLILVLAIFFGFHFLNQGTVETPPDNNGINSSNGQNGNNGSNGENNGTNEPKIIETIEINEGFNYEESELESGTFDGVTVTIPDKPTTADDGSSYVYDSSVIKGLRVGVLPDVESDVSAYVYVVFSGKDNAEFSSNSVDTTGLSAVVEVWSTQTHTVQIDPVTSESQKVRSRKLGSKEFEIVPSCVGKLSQDKNCHLHLEAGVDFELATLNEDRYGEVYVLINNVPNSEGIIYDSASMQLRE